jgi:hypothetical protein
MCHLGTNLSDLRKVDMANLLQMFYDTHKGVSGVVLWMADVVLEAMRVGFECIVKSANPEFRMVVPPLRHLYLRSPAKEDIDAQPLSLSFIAKVIAANPPLELAAVDFYCWRNESWDEYARLWLQEQ